jgi:hypothetical protein
MDPDMNLDSHTPTRGNSQLLAFNGAAIRDRGEMLSLTDMWKAGGEDPSKKPADWARKEGSDFIEHIAVVLNMPMEHILRASRGRTGATFAHWQIALAYAKYLSPDFHMWCNTVVRERMEGKAPATGMAITDISADVRKVLGGIVKSVVHSEIEAAIPALIEKHMAADARVAALEYVSVRELLNEAKALTKKRNGLNRRIGSAMRALALVTNPPAALRRCPHSGVWLYPRGFAAKFMALTGNAWVLAHNDRVTGQGALRLVRRPDGEGAPA